MTTAAHPLPRPNEGPRPRFRHLGVRWRLLLAFFGISALALFSAIASIYALSKLGGVLSEIAQNRMPAALVSQEISQQAERIVAAAPALLTLKSTSQQEDFSKQLADDIANLNRLLSELKGQASGGVDLGAIENSIESLNINLISIDTAVYNNAVLWERKQKLLDDLFDLYTQTRLLLTPALVEREETILDLKDELEDQELSPEARARLVQDYASQNEVRAVLVKSQLDLLLVKNTLLEIASTKQADDLQTTAISVGWSIDSLEELTASLDENLRANMLTNLGRFRGFLTGDNGIVAVRKAELKGIESVTELLSKNAKLSHVLIEEVADLVLRLRQGVTAANADALAVQRLSIHAVIGIVVLSVLSAGLIVWLYVSRNLIRRLSALSDSMLAIAGGDLQTQLPVPSGSDEISQMAEALVVFRDTAVEVAKTNLKEINEARRQLTDAIESISEGFSLYDSEDRLVVSNSRYREEMYWGIADIMLPGVPFESVLHAAAERGLVAGAEGRTEDWVAERIAWHKRPGAPHIQQQSDGRWIQIDERKTQDGGTVAVYTDITELKQSEQALAEKSKALEQLSSQLAKYLSPQVYDSIFTGKQEVKVASSRKKLTIFFSDIAGFTETADRLESEELTQLLNHYLTEMSQIALRHGATIDKYVGDAILIFFGDPETRGVREDALACVEMAIDMRRRMRELQELWRQSGIEKPLQVRMGIHTDYCTVGNFGSEDRLDYTIIGGAVNIASRLESLAAPGEILISYETFAHVNAEIACEPRGQTEVKGIAYPVATYCVLDSRENQEVEKSGFHEQQTHLRLDFDLASMTAEEREAAAKSLTQALRLLDQQPQSEPLSQTAGAPKKDKRSIVSRPRSGRSPIVQE